MNMLDRIKLLRKNLGINQKEFAMKIGLTQTSLSMIETDKSVLTERNIKLICKTFTVNEEWLRCGKGEMFDSLTVFERKLLKVFGQLTSDTQKLMVDFAENLLKIQEKQMVKKIDRD